MVTKLVEGPERIIEKIIEKEVPGPERIIEVKKVVPGPIRVVEKTVEVPGPERIIEVAGPERIIEKIIEKEVPGPERIIEKIIEKEVPGPERIIEVERIIRVPVENDISQGTLNTSFGTSFPSNPKINDVFLRVDLVPNVSYRYTGKNWVRVIELPANSIDKLAEQILSGELDWDNLTAEQQEQVRIKFRRENVLGK